MRQTWGFAVNPISMGGDHMLSNIRVNTRGRAALLGSTALFAMAAANPAMAQQAPTATPAQRIATLDPLYAVGERDLLEQVTAARGPAAGAALSRVYKRLRALPSRSQAAAPWGGGALSAGEFQQLHRDVAALCRTLGEEIE